MSFYQEFIRYELLLLLHASSSFTEAGYTCVLFLLLHSRMSKGKDQLVKFLCVEVKSGETQEKLKAKVLKAIHNSEKKSATITHPLQSWTDESHMFQQLKADEVVKVVANSTHIAFLLSDGRVCRVCVNSWEESSGSKTLSLDALRQPQQQPSFQVLGDEEFARQLQEDLNAHFQTWTRADIRGSSASVPFPSMYRNIDDLMQTGLQGIEVPRSLIPPLGPPLVMGDNALPTVTWR